MEGEEAKRAARLALEKARLRRKGGRPNKTVCSILCPGPSLHLFSEFPGKLIAVTDGIFHPVFDPGCDTWCFQEGPNHKHQPRFQRFGERVLSKLKKELWTRKGARDHWIHKWGIPKEVKIVDDKLVHEIVAEFPYEGRVWKEHRGTPRAGTENSCFYAIAKSIRDGFKEIHLFGADMEGHSNFDPVTGQKIGFPAPPSPHRSSTKKWWDARWVTERSLMNDVVSEAGSNGVEIVLEEAPDPVAA